MNRSSPANLFTSKNFPYFLQRVIAPVVLGILVISLIVYGVQFYIVSQEKKLNAQLHLLIDDFEDIEFEEGTLAYEEELTRLVNEFTALYEANKRSYSGKRALYHSGLTSYVVENFEEAEATLTMLLDQDEGFYLAPQALYFKALALEELGRYQEAIEALERYETLYAQSSFLTHEVTLVKARNYGWMGDYVEAEKIYRSIIKDTDEAGDLASLEVEAKSRAESNEQVYSDKAQEVLDLLKMLSNAKPSS